MQERYLLLIVLLISVALILSFLKNDKNSVRSESSRKNMKSNHSKKKRIPAVCRSRPNKLFDSIHHDFNICSTEKIGAVNISIFFSFLFVFDTDA